jgi:hypothetical protein
MIVREFPVKIEWNNRIEVFNVQLNVSDKGWTSIYFSLPETDELVGEWDRDMGGSLSMLGVDIEEDEREYLDLEWKLFVEVFKVLPHFFSDEVIEGMSH